MTMYYWIEERSHFNFNKKDYVKTQRNATEIEANERERQIEANVPTEWRHFNKEESRGSRNKEKGRSERKRVDKKREK